MNSSSHVQLPTRQAFQLKPIALAICVLGGVCSGVALAEPAEGEVASFESDMLWGQGARSMNLSRFRESNLIEPGTYNLEIVLNGTPVGPSDIVFVAGEQPGHAKACFSRLQLEQFGVKLDQLPEDKLSGDCLDLASLIEGASASVDVGEQRLELSIPQAMLRHNPRGYVSPERWDRGVNAGFLDYNLSGYQNSSQGVAQQSAYASLNAGLNLGDWRLRQRSALNWGQEGKSLQNLATFAQRDVDSLRSQLTLGDAFTDGDLFDSVSMRGVRLNSDDRMLPDSQRGYAPIVRGIASTNARVTIRQNGYIIHEETVAPGAFEISDLNPTSDNGDLDVTVTEANGQESHFTVPFSSVARSLRPGVSRYTFSLGQVRDLTYGYSPYIAQGTYQRGITNSVTAYTGSTLTEGYASVLLGGVLNTEYGAFGADLTQSSTDLDGQNFTGRSVRISYNKVLQSTGTHFTVAAHRYSTDGYFGVDDALNAQDQLREYGDEEGGADAIRRARSRSEINVSQSIGRGYLFVSGSVQNYWNDTGSDTQFQAGYNHSWNWGSASVSASRTQDAFGESENQVLLSVSLPIGKVGGNRPYLTSSVSHSSSGASNMQSTLSGTAGKDGQINYGVTGAYDSPADSQGAASLSGNTQYRSSFGTLNGSMSQGSDYRQVSAGIAGSVVAHPNGVTFGQTLGDSIAIIDAPGAAGAQVTNASNVKLDGQGQAVVPYLTAYRVNTLELDPKGLSDDIELKSTAQDVVPRSGSVVMVKFDTVSGHALLIQSRQSDGSPLPFGASVYNEKNQEVGVVGQGGKIFVRVDGDSGKLHVLLASEGSKRCSITYSVPATQAGGKDASLETIDAVCAG
ncbi:fimbrial biogenesis outer membrane usher protein [Pseudomonas sp. PDNC002]|uniref:fimbria/pilus outer membrane usher protein n=1 Tax=Pseudomonas sp. PDNC002 TaxID=2811422 RepID=UPI0019643F66|nr:fimbria/pilus outer membrane usher protein [Pseudomonas sp. PDNC002]QRY76961.1 fimbrial biogenesis outer membrane usher protein [Pseudomonas sp. PDNC002]